LLAELHGKLDPTAIDPVERSEDLLTDAVFGSIRHLPRVEVLGALLQTVGIVASSKDLARADVRLWPQVPMPRWPGKIIEPDVLVIVGKQPVIFEAKLYSEFGLYPEPGIDTPFHQLAVQFVATSAWAEGERLQPPIVIAVTASSQPPLGDLRRAKRDIERMLDLSPEDGSIQWVSWRAIADILEAAEGLRHHERAHRDDVLALMEKRGVRRMFNGFQPEDYWLVSAAQRVAGDRLYPQLRSFIEDLAAVLADDGIGWSQPSYRAMWMIVGTSVSKPTDWTRSFVGAQFWPETWPNRNGRLGANLGLYAAFDFLDPALEVGLSIPGPGAALAQQQWTPHLALVAEQLATLPSGFDLAFDAGDPARPSKQVATSTVDAAWLGSVAGAAVGTSHLRLRRRTDPLSLTIQEARELLGEVRVAVESCPALWEALRSSGHLAEEQAPSSDDASALT
jgi:hypothetical protein